MKKIKSYSKIWNVEGTLFAIGDTNLPVPLTYSQILWFVISFVFMLIVGDVFPLSLIDSWLLKNFAIPIGIAVLMNKIEFEGKKPIAFIVSYVLYLLRPKRTYGGKAISKKRKHRLNTEITIVRSVRV